MYRTCARFSGYSTPLLFLPSLPAPLISRALAVSAISTTFFLNVVTSVEVAKTDIRFLTHFLDFEGTYWSSAPFYGSYST